MEENKSIDILESVKQVRVYNMSSSNGNDVPNQFVIELNNGVLFRSYNSNIVFKSFNDRKTYIDKQRWEYSNTTGKYRNKFLGEDKKETLKKIKSGEYILTELNR